MYAKQGNVITNWSIFLFYRVVSGITKQGRYCKVGHFLLQSRARITKLANVKKGAGISKQGNYYKVHKVNERNVAGQ